MKALLLLALLAGCDASLPKRFTVSVPVACISPDQIPARPPLAMDVPRSLPGPRTRALLIYQADAAPYIAALEAIAAGCSTLGR